MVCFPKSGHIHINIVTCMYFIVAITVNINQSIYSVLEHNRTVQPVLVLSKPSPYCIFVRVEVMDLTATGELHMYVRI